MRRFALIGVALCFLTQSGFRVFEPEASARRAIERAEEGFTVSKHAELYRFTRLGRDGEARSGRMIIAFCYEEGLVRGVFRILPGGGSAGATLMVHQEPGAYPRVYLHEPGANLSRELGPGERRRKLPGTDWYIEGIYDDDKVAWELRETGVSRLRGRNADIVRARPPEGPLRRDAHYAYRLVYFTRPDDELIRIEYFDAADELVYGLNMLEKDRFVIDGKPQSRNWRFALHDYRNDSTTLMTRVRGLYETGEIPEKIYEFGFAAEWDGGTDAELISLMR